MQISYISTAEHQDCQAIHYALWQVQNGFVLASCNRIGIFRLKWYPSLSAVAPPYQDLLPDKQALELRQKVLDETAQYVVYGTEFQCKVWRQVASIPPKCTASYADIARSVGCPQASRAVGGAVGKNPLYLIIPCHRVVASNGSLGGYAWGLTHKRALLDCEKRGESWFV